MATFLLEFKAMSEYASGSGAHANNVTQLVGTDLLRMRISDFPVIFAEAVDAVTVVKVGPRGGVYG